jgi:hypothetical protein
VHKPPEWCLADMFIADSSASVLLGLCSDWEGGRIEGTLECPTAAVVKFLYAILGA